MFVDIEVCCLCSVTSSGKEQQFYFEFSNSAIVKDRKAHFPGSKSY